MVTAAMQPTSPNVRFWDRIAKSYAARPVSDQTAYERKLFETQMRLTPDMKALEIGCGTGSTALAHAPFVDHITAVDLSPNMIKIARAKADAAGVSNASFSVAAIESLEAEDGAYDVVFGLSLLHLVADAIAAKRIRQWLKPGGLFISNTARLDDGCRWLRLIAPPARWLGRFPDLTFFGEDQLLEEMRGAGFEIDWRWRPARRKASFIVAKAV